MMEFFDSAPAVEVPIAEYTRLLGFPRDHVIDGRARELADWARAWYAEHGRPWVYAREAQEVSLRVESVQVDGQPFASPRLCRTLSAAGAHSVALVAVSAGPEIEDQARRAWLDEKPDEYFFLEMLGSAVVEHLTTTSGARLCAWADGQGMAVLPHYSPGYPEWDIADQSKLFNLMSPDALPGPIEVLESGMLRPKKSLLAVFGLTRHVDRVRHLSELVPCEQCSFTPCQYRRAPYVRASAAGVPVEAAGAGDTSPASPVPQRYRTNPTALRRWAAERLVIEAKADGSIAACFHYDGTTCSNMGRRLRFIYDVTLGPGAEGYRILAGRCTPAPDDEGHPFMCEYIRDTTLMATIAQEQPLVGHRLGDVLDWDRPLMGPACFCESDARRHKWGLVLETIHFALHQQIRRT